MVLYLPINTYCPIQFKIQNIWEENHIRIRRLRWQQQAVFGLPIYLTVVVVVLSVISFFLYGSLQETLRTQDIHHCTEEIQRILSEATHMYTYGSDTARATLSLDVPSSIQVLVFGGLPKNESMEVIHDQTTESNYFYTTDDGSLVTGHAQARFCGQTTSSAATFPPGHYHVTLELLMTTEGPYVKITY